MGRPVGSKNAKHIMEHSPVHTGDDEHYLTTEEIEEVVRPYVPMGLKLSVDEKTWSMKIVKRVTDLKGKILGQKELEYQGTRCMPVKDLESCIIDNVMAPIHTPSVESQI